MTYRIPRPKRLAIQKFVAEHEDCRASGARLKITEARRIGCNDPCPCGSGVKFKKCCGQNLPRGDKRVRE